MSRQIISLNGVWGFALDPYGMADRQQRWKSPSPPPDAVADRVFPVDWTPLRVPGTWNTQRKEFFYYAGTAVYQREFEFAPKLRNRRVFLRFDGANYRTTVWLNGEKLGVHRGGFTPFSFEITNLIRRRNHLFVEVDNTEKKDRCPTIGPDWFNYGGIHRGVGIEIVPAAFIREHFIWWDGRFVRGRIAVDGCSEGTVCVRIGNLINEELSLRNGVANLRVKAAPRPWSPEDPYLYPVTITCGSDVVRDRIGLRTITTDGARLLLNGRDIRLKGICVHGESEKGGRTMTRADMLRIFELARELRLNFLRLAHYPHDAEMSRLADRFGLVLWEEIPVYWRIDWLNKDTLADAKNQLAELIRRDRNRASVAIWSVANETPENAEGRTAFLANLARQAKRSDPTRLVSLALFMKKHDNGVYVSDPIGSEVDIIALNTYPMWYTSSLDIAELEPVIYQKPHFVSEWGGGALAGLRGRGPFTEDYQAKIYRTLTRIIEKKEFIRGTSPWILADFRSLLRINSVQRGHNLKGLVDITKRKKKLAFGVYRDWVFE